jgi:hypothetical protein
VRQIASMGGDASPFAAECRQGPEGELRRATLIGTRKIGIFLPIVTPITDM